jgi:hypothetical protein
MTKTRMNCPNCRQPILADIDQLFDVGTDPEIKQKFLSGMFNIAQCPQCRYQGSLATPIVYHDPAKELLLTYYPPELGMPINEQERIIGPLITKVMNNLPQEKRKAYLLRPQTMLTLQSMVEKVLEADGITKEMLQAQQLRLSLIQRLMTSTSEEAIAEIIKQEDALMDADFFNLLSRLVQASLAGGDQESAQQLSSLQNVLLASTTFGHKVQEQNKEIEAAVRSLQEAGEELTREKLLDLVIKAPNDLQLSVMVSMARPGMDYEFFRLLSERIDRARGDGRERLIELRERLLEMTRAVDQQMEERAGHARKNLKTLLEASDIRQATTQNLPMIDEFFVQALSEEMDAARKSGDLERIGKLGQIQQVLEEASTPPPELALIQELLEIPNEIEMKKQLEAHRAELTPEFLEILTQLVAKTESTDEPELNQRLQIIYQQALRITMQANL